MEPDQGRPDLRLIVITDAALAAPRDVRDIVAAALEAGAPAIQLRDKGAMPADLYRLARDLVALTHPAGALLFVNDRLDVALAAGADGVHLGPDDLPVHAARRAVQRARSAGGSPLDPDRPFLIGASADDPRVARDAEAQGADYIGCGAVFGTTSKPETGDERIGTERLAEVAHAVRIPVVGIGGITPANVSEIAAAGAAGAAVIGAVMAADDPVHVTRALLRPFRAG